MTSRSPRQASAKKGGPSAARSGGPRGAKQHSGEKEKQQHAGEEEGPKSPEALSPPPAAAQAADASHAQSPAVATPAAAPQATYDYVAPKEYIKPDDQLALTESELAEEITRILTANNPNAPDNIVRFSFKDRMFKPEPSVEQLEIHFSMDGNILHRDSEEAKRQTASSEPEQREEAGVDADIQADDDLDIDKKTHRNQFNFSERASQTYNNAPKERGTLTEPPPRHDFSATATQWDIYDTYMEDQERQRAAKEKLRHAKGIKDDDEDSAPEPRKAKEVQPEDVIHSGQMAKSAKVMERMVNQNKFDDITQDYKYWDDPSDQFREGEGSLLPLWKFNSPKAKKKQVTALCCNPDYKDLFAVGYGSYDFLRPTPGAISCFSLKNPSYPECTFTTESGVMCLHFHPQHASLLAVGLYDGRVMVFDISSKVNRPIFQSTAKSGKHTDPVWQVCWQEEDMAKNLNFFSVSSDGRVTLWTMIKNELQHTDIMELKLNSMPKEIEADEETTLFGLAGGCSFDFNWMSEHLFVVGTEEGQIHKCSKAYNSQYLETYNGHKMAVYSVKWNPFHPKVFLSCSADWTVKLWDHTRKSPIMSFDLNNSVGDIAWSPYSATVFAAVTADGRVHVFDLAESKHEAMCEQQAVRKAKLTHVVFNKNEPMIFVGDEKGIVTSLKVSPNLRNHGTNEEEFEKLDRILRIAEKNEAAL